MGAENPCHQVIFVDDAASAVTPLDPEMIKISNAVGQGRNGAAWFRARCGTTCLRAGVEARREFTAPSGRRERCRGGRL